jgi:hypothetical protein
MTKDESVQRVCQDPWNFPLPFAESLPDWVAEAWDLGPFRDVLVTGRARNLSKGGKITPSKQFGS